MNDLEEERAVIVRFAKKNLSNKMDIICGVTELYEHMIDREELKISLLEQYPEKAYIEGIVSVGKVYDKIHYLASTRLALNEMTYRIDLAEYNKARFEKISKGFLTKRLLSFNREKSDMINSIYGFTDSNFVSFDVPDSYILARNTNEKFRLVYDQYHPIQSLPEGIVVSLLD